MTISENEILNYWGDNLFKITAQAVEGITIPKYTKNILKDIGLPMSNMLLVNFYIVGIKYILFRGKGYILIGDDYGTKLGIDMNTEEVFSLPDTEDIHPKFINSNIKFFILFLLIYHMEISKIKGSKEEEIKLVAKQLREKFLQIDSKSLSDNESWWNLILEEIDYGMA